MARHNDIGHAGEAIAKRYLEERSYRILETNWRYRRAEVDLIAMDGKTLVFVEVKTRNTTAFGEIEDFVTRKKEDLLIAAAHAYMEHIDHDWEIRFDIIAILYLDEQSYSLKHIEDAFFPGLE
ncbi:YraN family protein [Phaeodactylibacter sp.]|uniref:YraN family protein n=1 Tax=Phaeodactylibacter sp. TaxID=1940289 RepID=UPI0025F7FE2E|nr:YraN family protein [Phaeodactylibacter sp.]MCI4651527.1 YraN family protein [Phaeodactylibacter sp.]MCI5094379.1 YraN family protein [Phaeodactylibacter sp.]